MNLSSVGLRNEIHQGGGKGGSRRISIYFPNIIQYIVENPQQTRLYCL